MVDSLLGTVGLQTPGVHQGGPSLLSLFLTIRPGFWVYVFGRDFGCVWGSARDCWAGPVGGWLAPGPSELSGLVCASGTRVMGDICRSLGLED